MSLSSGYCTSLVTIYLDSARESPIHAGPESRNAVPHSTRFCSAEYPSHNRWGESLPPKPGGDDIPRDGSACDSAATPTEQSQPRQMALGEVGSEPTAGW